MEILRIRSRFPQSFECVLDGSCDPLFRICQRAIQIEKYNSFFHVSLTIINIKDFQKKCITEIQAFNHFQKSKDYCTFKTLVERKSRILQIQGVQGRSRSNLLRVLGNAGDGVSPAFPKGKQNREKNNFLTHHCVGYKSGLTIEK